MNKEQAILELESYVDRSKYTTNLEQLNYIIDLGVQDINGVKDDEPIDLIERFVVEYKKMIDAILTDVGIQTAILDEHKRKARIELNSYNDESRYYATEKQLLATYIQDGLQAIDNANNKPETDDAISQAVDLIVALPQKEYKDKSMYLNTSTHELVDIQSGADPDLYDGESDYRLIQLYHNQFSGLTFPGTSRPQPSLKLFTMSKEEVQ